MGLDIRLHGSQARVPHLFAIPQWPTVTAWAGRVMETPDTDVVGEGLLLAYQGLLAANSLLSLATLNLSG